MPLPAGSCQGRLAFQGLALVSGDASLDAVLSHTSFLHSNSSVPGSSVSVIFKQLKHSPMLSYIL